MGVEAVTSLATAGPVASPRRPLRRMLPLRLLVGAALTRDERRFAANLARSLRAEGFVMVHAGNGVDGLWDGQHVRRDRPGRQE